METNLTNFGVTMIIPISVGIIALAFVALVIFLIKTLINVNDVIKQTKISMMHLQKDVDELSEESVRLIKTINELSSDIKSKSASLNFLFQPMKEMTRERSRHHEADRDEKVSSIADWVTASIQLYNNLKRRGR